MLYAGGMVERNYWGCDGAMGHWVWEDQEDDGPSRFWVPGPMSGSRLRERWGPRFPGDSEVTVQGSGGEGQTLTWSQVLRRGIEPGERICLPGSPTDAGPLLHVLERLLGEQGCPWDRQQTSFSLLPFLLDEAYEAAEALVSDDVEGFHDELGDVLLQVAFHSALFGNDAFSAIVVHQVHKLIRRHPHVFADVQGWDAQTVMKEWDTMKSAEPQRILAGDWMFPALVQAKRASKRGIKPDSAVFHQVFDLLQVYSDQPREKIEETLADAAWAVAAVGQRLHYDAEWALWRKVASSEREDPGFPGNYQVDRG